MGVLGRWDLFLPRRDGALREVPKRCPSPHPWPSEMALMYILEEVERVSPWLSSWALTGPHTGNSVSAPERLHQVQAGTARLVHPGLWVNFSVTSNVMVLLGNLARNIHALGQFRGMVQLKTRATSQGGTVVLLGLHHASRDQGGKHNECLLTSCSLGVVTKATAPPSTSCQPLRGHAPPGSPFLPTLPIGLRPRRSPKPPITGRVSLQRVERCLRPEATL